MHHLDACWLQLTSLHGSSNSIFTPLHVSHFQWFAPCYDVMFAHCGAVSNFFYPKHLPNVGHYVAPVCRAGGMQKGVLDLSGFFWHVA